MAIEQYLKIQDISIIRNSLSAHNFLQKKLNYIAIFEADFKTTFKKNYLIYE
jgi:hypothetical protein